MKNDVEVLDARLAVYREVVLKASQDPAFRAALKADPVKTLTSVFGIEWDAAVALEVVEETPERSVLVLPLLAVNDDELSDADLEKVAAGATTSCAENRSPVFK